MPASRLQVTVWNEFRHEKQNPRVAEIYPNGMHETIAAHLRKSSDLAVRTATLDEPEQGLPARIVDSTDVMIWWGHGAHQELRDDLVDRVHGRVLAGMGLVVLHSGHFAKIFKKLMGTTCNLKWRADGERETLWVTRPGHPIVAGIGEFFTIEREEMYGEFFDIPAPDELVFVSSFSGGEVFRSGCCFRRGRGQIFYFGPGHETFPVYHQAEVQRVIANAARWAAAAA
jgi:trehalose utilization protein